MDFAKPTRSGPVLVTGGAGYVGSHAVRCLQANDIDVVVVDNLCTGFDRLISAPLDGQAASSPPRVRTRGRASTVTISITV